MDMVLPTAILPAKVLPLTASQLPAQFVDALKNPLLVEPETVTCWVEELPPVVKVSATGFKLAVRAPPPPPLPFTLKVTGIDNGVPADGVTTTLPLQVVVPRLKALMLT